MNEYVPFGAKLTCPLGWPIPKESCTAKVAVLGLMPDKLSAIVPDIVTGTIFPFGGQRVAGLPEPVITGGVLSILIVTGTEVDRPTPFVAEQAMVTPAVSAINVVPKQPFEEETPDSRSATDQNTVTLLRYHPFVPSVPET